MMMRMEGGAILGLQIRMFCPRAYICSNFPAGDGQSKGRGQRNGKNPGWEISFHESVSVASSSISHSQASHRLRQISDQLEATKSTKPAQVRKENDPIFFSNFPDLPKTNICPIFSTSNWPDLQTLYFSISFSIILYKFLRQTRYELFFCFFTQSHLQL